MAVDAARGFAAGGFGGAHFFLREGFGVNGNVFVTGGVVVAGAEFCTVS